MSHETRTWCDLLKIYHWKKGKIRNDYLFCEIGHTNALTTEGWNCAIFQFLGPQFP